MTVGSINGKRSTVMRIPLLHLHLEQGQFQRRELAHRPRSPRDRQVSPEQSQHPGPSQPPFSMESCQALAPLVEPGRHFQKGSGHQGVHASLEALARLCQGDEAPTGLGADH